MGTYNLDETVSVGDSGHATMHQSENIAINDLDSRLTELSSSGITNLVPLNFANGGESGALTGFGVDNGTVSSVTTDAKSGTHSVQLTSSGTSGAQIRNLTGTSGFPVSPSTLYTAIASFKAASTPRICQVFISWYDSSGASISSSSSSSIPNGVYSSTSAWVPAQVSAVSPSNAAYVAILARFTPAASGEVHYIDELGLWAGYGGRWALPGSQIQGLGEHWDEASGRRLFKWDFNNAREQLVYGDTGWRDIASVVTWNDTQVASDGRAFAIRRVGNLVEMALRFKSASGFSASYVDSVISGIPTGFTPASSAYVQYPDLVIVQSSGSSTVRPAGFMGVKDNGIIEGAWIGDGWAAGSTYRGHVMFNTLAGWPTSLPGTSLAGGVPNC